MTATPPRRQCDRNTPPKPPSSEDITLGLFVQNVLDYAIFLMDAQGRIISWNAGAERIKGYSTEEIIGKHFSIFYPPEEVAAGKPDWELEVAAAEGRMEDEGWRVRKDGTWFWANVVITALYDDQGRLVGFGKVTRDMSERRAAEKALTQRRRLLAHLVQAQEMERRRIAWDVHDDSIQAMTTVAMRLQLLAAKLPEESAESVRQLNEAVTASIGRLRDLVFRLRPPGIDSSGLVESLSSYLEQVVSQWGLTYALHDELKYEPPPEPTITVFRICQEALTNIRKHAHASSVTVSLATVDQGVLVRVSDDGIGIDEQAFDQLSGLEHFGMNEMRERAETAGGWWKIRGQPGIGTTVEFWVPAPLSPDGSQMS